MALLQQDRTRFWAEAFDMDLPKLLPELREQIGAVGDETVWTFGSVSRDGVFYHPSVWNCHVGTEAYFWTSDPGLPRDEHGWINFRGRSTDEPLCQISVWEAIRDCWCHTYSLRLNGHEVLRSGPRFYNSHFYPLMADLRGWKLVAPASRIRLLMDVEGWAVQGGRNFDAVIRNRP